MNNFRKIAISAIILFLFLGETADAAWYGWSYRKSHVINSATGAGTNYQVKVTVHYGSGTDSSGDVYCNSKCKTDFGDIRFTDSTGGFLDYWMERKTDSDNAVFWVEIAGSLESTSQTIYIYYGNSSASTTSNGDNSFLFFDDFNDGAIDTNKWTSAGSMAEAGGYATGSVSGTDYLFGKTRINIDTSTVIRMRDKVTTDSARPGVLQSHGNPYSIPGFGWQDYSNGYRYTDTYESAINQQQWGLFTTDWYLLETAWQTSSVKFWVDGSLLVTHTSQIPSSSRVLYAQVEGRADYDYIYTRKYTSPEPAHAATWGSEETSSAWKYRRKITIDHTKVNNVTTPSTTYAGFPMLVYATGLSNVKTGGADIRFTSSNGVSELPREIESYSSGTLYAWVKVTLTKDAGDSSDDYIYMYYGNSGASEPAADSTYGSQNVWDTNYKMVQHLPDGSTLTASDSTSNSNNGTINSATATAGKMDGGGNFSGSTQYIRTSNNIGDDFTVSAWIKTTDTGGTGAAYSGDGIIYSDLGGAANDMIPMALVGSQLGFGTGGTSYNTLTSTSSINTGSWVYAVVTRVKSSGAKEIFINGSYETASTGETPSLTARTYIDVGGNTLDGRYFTGQLDEVRYSDIVRSDDWIKTEYNNQNSASTFYSIGGEEGNNAIFFGANF